MAESEAYTDLSLEELEQLIAKQSNRPSGCIKEVDVFTTGKAPDLAHLTKEAEDGNKDAQYLLGCLYSLRIMTQTIDDRTGASDNVGIRENIFKESVQMTDAKAETWLRKAALQGHSAAMYSLAWKIGPKQHPKEEREALEWIIKSAKNGYTPAVEHVGSLYMTGYSCSDGQILFKQDYSKALTWLKRASGNGSIEAIFNLSALYSEGWGVQRDMEKAKALLLSAAARGHKKAVEVCNARGFKC